MESKSHNLDRIKSIRIVPFDSSCRERKYLASCGARYFEVSESLALCMELLGKTGSFAETACRLSGIRDRKYSEDDVKAIYKQYILPIMDEKDAKKPKMFIWSKELLSPELVGRISGMFKVLFRPFVAGLLLLCVMALEIIFFSMDMTMSAGDIDMVYIIAITLLFVASSCVHELGHAAACCHYGAEPGGIGFGLYINFPVFYTDVSDIWTLERKKRMVVNFSGVYFQLVFLIPFLVYYFVTGNHLIKYFIYTINLNFIFTLNPFFKFDGYWAMSDFIGISNLREKSNSLMRYVKNKILRKKSEDAGFLKGMGHRERIVFFVYSVVVNLFFLYYFLFVLPKFVYSLVMSFPGQAEHLVRLVATGGTPSFSLVSSVAGQLVMAALMLLFLYRLIAGLVRKKDNA